MTTVLTMSPSAIPCRMCQAGPGEPCKYKGAAIRGSLGGHKRGTPRDHRTFHYKRVADLHAVQKEIA